MKKIYLFWESHDGLSVEEFENIIHAEKRIDALKAQHAKDNYGFNIIAVIKGVKMEIEEVTYSIKNKLN